MVEKLLTITVNLSLTVAIARFLGPEQFGVISYVLAFVSLSYPLTRLGLAGILTKEIVEDKISSNILLGTVVHLRFIVAIFLLTLFIVLVIIFDFWSETQTKGILFLFAANLFASVQVVNFKFQALKNNRPVALARIGALVSSNFGKLILLFWGAPTLLFVIWLSVEVLLISGFQIAQYIRYYGSPLDWTFDLTVARELLRKSWWLILSGFAAVIYLKIDQLMIYEMVGNAELGLYTIAVRFSEIWYFIPTVIMTAYFPQIVKIKNSSIDKYNEMIVRILFILLVIGFCITMAILIGARFLIPILFGNDFQGSIAMLNIQILSLVFVFMRALVSKWIIIEDLPKYSLVSHGVGLIINVLLNIWLIPIYGGIGAAYATLIAYIMASYVVFVFSKKTRLIFIQMTQALTLLFKPLLWSRVLKGKAI